MTDAMDKACCRRKSHFESCGLVATLFSGTLSSFRRFARKQVAFPWFWREIHTYGKL